MLLGGAALTRTYVERDLREVYEGRLFYGKDAFEGLHVMDRLMDAQARRATDDPDCGRVPIGPGAAEAGVRARRRGRRRDDPGPLARRWRPTTRSSCRRSSGSRIVKGISLDDIAGYLNETALFRNQWQYRPESGRGRRRRSRTASAPDAARAAGRGQGRGRARAAGRLRLLRR